MRFAFGHHELDAARFELRREGELVPIQPKVLELIVYLVLHRDRSVAQGELLAAVWPGTVVTTSSLARAVSLARRAIGDSPSSPQTIVTVPRRGYRFASPVQVQSDSPVEDDPATLYVGRSQILARARSVLDHALAGHGRILFLAGEAGIGKTRTAELLAERARAARAEVTTAWGLVQGAPTYWSWTCVLRQLLDADPRALESLSAVQRAHLAWIVPDAAAGSGKVLPGSGDATRLRLFEAVLAFFSRVARTRPLAIILDDLHAADAESLGLLEYVGRALTSLPIAIVVTCREEDIALAPQQTRAHERLLRLGCLERWPLTGLHDDDLREFVRRQLGHEPDLALIAALERQTGGNPLLLGESLRSLEARGLLGQVRERTEWESLLPRGIEHLLRPKLRQISAGAVEALGCAAAIGVDFERSLLVRSSPDAADFEARLDEVMAVGLLSTGVGTARLRFAHALVRDAIYEALVPPGAARRALHARIWAALDAGSEASGAPLAESARHACEASPLVDPRRAAALARGAGEQAARLYDFEGAARWFERALEVQSSVDPPDLELHAAISLELALAEVRSLGLERARASLLLAADAARQCRRGDLLALVALGFAQRPNSTGQGDPEVAALLDEALRALPKDAVALRIRISSRLAAELRYSERERTLTLAAQALAEARQLGDPAVLAQTLDDCTFIQWSPSDPGAWIDLNAEVVLHARTANDLDLAISGHKGCVSGTLEIGDLAGAQRAIRACERIARDVPTAYVRWWCTVFQASRALVEGELEVAEGLILESIRIAERIDSPEVAIELQAQFVYLRTEQGRVAEIEAATREQVRRFPNQPTWRAALGRILVASGDLAEARQAIAPLVEREFAEIPIDRGWFGTHAFAAEVVAAIGDEKSAERLEEHLRPFSGRTIVVGSALYYGPVAHYLGLLAATRSHWDAAIACFEAALAAEQRAGARVFAARTRVAYARALLARGADGDRSRSLKLVREAMDVAERRQLLAVSGEATDLHAALWGRGQEEAPARLRVLAPRRRVDR